MIRHIVFFKFKPGTGEAKIAELKEKLGGLPGQIPEILAFEFGEDVIHSPRSYDFALIGSFADLEALDRYQVHPDHQLVIALVREISESVVAVDFNH